MYSFRKCEDFELFTVFSLAFPINKDPQPPLPLKLHQGTRTLSMNY